MPEPAGYIECGRIYYRGKDLLDYTVDEMRAVRGQEIAMIFQEPMSALNPVFTVGDQLGEALAATPELSPGAPRASPGAAGARRSRPPAILATTRTSFPAACVSV